MRVALAKVDFFYSNGSFLSYSSLRDLFKDLNPTEHDQIVDYILSKYNFISFESLVELYGTYEKMLGALDSNAGAEFELEDEYGDHSFYRKMLNTVMRYGYKYKRLNFESLPEEEVKRIFNLLRATTGAPRSCINKFLHSNY